jgi:4-hydroxybenzoate polyprenyltransferase
MSSAARVIAFGHLVRFSHTVFALPFAVMGALMAARGVPGARVLGWIIVAMVGARSAAMAMNRLADHRLDAENPRTRGRELPAGTLRRGEVWAFLLLTVALFVVACAALNRLTFVLSPVVLVVLLGYPYAKRFTSLCHLWLGAALGLSPVGAYVAVRGRFDADFPAVVLLGVAVLLWTAGFDVIYAMLDMEHDRRTGIFSLPARFGGRSALLLSGGFHAVTVGLLAFVGVAGGLGAIWYAGVATVTLLMIYEHAIVRPSDLSRVNTAFFTVNGLISFGLMLFLAADVLIR